MPGRLAIVSAVNPPMSADVRAVEYVHADDGELYRHDFGPGVSLRAMRDGSIKLAHTGGKTVHRDFGGQRFLVNPRRRKAPMARRAQPRYKSGPKKGQFKPRGRGGSSSRKTTTRKRTTRKNPPATTRRRRAPRRNAPKLTPRNVIRSAVDGTKDAALVLVGKGATRTIPVVANLPRGGPAGLAIQGLTAVLVSMVARNFLKPAQAKMVLAGGLSAPLETLVVSYDVPFLANALQPGEQAAQLQAYLHGYVEPAAPLLPAPVGLDGYANEEPGSGYLGQYYGEPTFA